MSCVSFRGGHWRYLPIRNHDNRYFADWIRLCPGLSKNSENGYSCPKPHKAARHDWSSGKSGQHWDWDYSPQYGFYHGEAHGFAEKNWWSRPEWTERVAVLECGYSPKQIAILSFGSPIPALPGKVVVGNLSLGKNTAVRRSCSLPHSTDDYKLLHTHTNICTHFPSPHPSPPSLWNPPVWQAGLWPAPRMAAGLDGCLLELDHFPCCKVCLWFMCFCWGVSFLFSHCTPQGA